LAELFKVRSEVNEAIENYARAISVMEELIADFERALFDVKSKRMNMTVDDGAIGTSDLNRFQRLSFVVNILFYFQQRR